MNTNYAAEICRNKPQLHSHKSEMVRESSAMDVTKVRTDSSTEFGSDLILIDRIGIKSATGSNPILIRTAVDRAVDFNERVTAFTTGRACAAISDINGGNADIQLRCTPAYN